MRDVGQEATYPPPPFNQEITEMIIQSRALAASDASVRDREIGGVWIIKKISGEEVLSNRIYHKKQTDNSSKLAEALILLELI